MQGERIYVWSIHTGRIYHSVLKNAQPVGLDCFRGIGGRPNEQKNQDFRRREILIFGRCTDICTACG